MSWRAIFADQAKTCADLGSPFTAAVLTLIAENGLPDGPVADRIASWPGDISSRGASVPLRLAGALHALILLNKDPRLAAQYPPNPLDLTALSQAVDTALIRHMDHIDTWLNSAPQTNEVARSAALIAATGWLAQRHSLPIGLSELGASAGLNLMFDRYALQAGPVTLGATDPVLTLTPDWRGKERPTGGFTIVDRAGVDLSPLDPVADRLRLLSYIWPDQPDRMARIAAALDQAALTPPDVAKGDAIKWLEHRLAIPMPGRLHLIYHTIAWQYFPPDAQTRGETLLAEAGARATPDAPIARLAVEADGHTPGAHMQITLWPGGRALSLGRFDFHGRWIEWRPDSQELS